MSPLMTILRAAHCRSTHHFFAIDSLRLVQTDAGIRFRGILLKHHEKFLTGAKDPDDRFRDFQNHVIHVSDGYFGGAPRLAIQWYDRLMGHLVAGRWEDSAYAMGVLSHYFTDPLMPLHTAQSEREALVHRPMEWSICKSYDRILKLWTEDNLRLVFQLGDREDWLGEAILKGARFANRSYKRLVESYDIDLGTANPAAGLNPESLQTFAELFGLAITGLARIVERAAGEAEARCGVTLPKVGLTMPALLAALQVPEQMWVRRIENFKERLAIKALIEEYRETGTVKENIPDEVYVKQRVMEVRERESAWATRQSERVRARELAAAQTAPETTAKTGAMAETRAMAEIITFPQTTGTASTLEAIAAEMPVESAEVKPLAVAVPVSDDEGADDERPVSLPFPTLARTAEAAEPTSSEKLRLDRSDELSKAPSIGPKTAAAFAELKIFTVGEFLDAPAAAIVRRLDKQWITTHVITDWQAQTLLMCQVAGLLSRDVQMLVGVDIRTAESLAVAEATTLVAMMNRYATTSEGRRALRGASPADVFHVEQWIASASKTSRSRKAA